MTDRSPSSLSGADERDPPVLPDSTPILRSVIDTVSAATDTDPQELPRLSRVIDLDALDRLYRHDGGGRDTCSRIEFAVTGCDVQVTTDGRVDVVPSGSESRRTST